MRRALIFIARAIPAALAGLRLLVLVILILALLFLSEHAAVIWIRRVLIAKLVIATILVIVLPGVAAIYDLLTAFKQIIAIARIVALHDTNQLGVIVMIGFNLYALTPCAVLILAIAPRAGPVKAIARWRPAVLAITEIRKEEIDAKRTAVICVPASIMPAMMPTQRAR